MTLRVAPTETPQRVYLSLKREPATADRRDGTGVPHLRRGIERDATWFLLKGLTASAYHARRKAAERTQVHEASVSGELDVVV